MEQSFDSMPDATQQDPDQQSEISAAPGTLRWKTAAVLAAIAAIAALISLVVAPDRTILVICLYYSVGGLIVSLTAWWLFLSGVLPAYRIFGLIAAGSLMAGVLVGSVRQIHFSGDMVPRFEWRWQNSASETSAEWLKQNSPAAKVAVEFEPGSFQVTTVDWPRYCGTGGDRIIQADKPDFDWSTNPPTELWRHPVGEGWSSMSIVGSHLFTQEQRGDQECIVCYDSATGAEIWRHEDTARYSTPMGGTGPRATPTVSSDAVFALGATGLLTCLHPQNGKLIWQRNICADAGSDILEWGMSGSPLLYADTVIVDAGGQQNKAVIAYDQDTGEIRWASDNHQAGYAAPRIEQIDGQEQLLIFHGEGLQGLDPTTGARLWEYPWTNMYKINVAQPIRFGDQLFLSSGYDSGCVLIDPTQLTNGVPAEVWAPNKSIKLKFNEAVSKGQYVYGLDDGILACVDTTTGKRVWKGGRYRFGQVLLWDDVLLVQAEMGFVAVVEASPDQFKELARFSALSDRDDDLQTKAWNAPAVCNGRLYIRDAYEMACYQLASQPTLTTAVQSPDSDTESVD
jgi:outer membrane protein assembly factor BamB